jgi:hypothetical protein
LAALGVYQGVVNCEYPAGVEAIVIDKNDIEKAPMLYLGDELDDRPELGCDHGQVATGESPS